MKETDLSVWFNKYIDEDEVALEYSRLRIAVCLIERVSLPPLTEIALGWVRRNSS